MDDEPIMFGKGGSLEALLGGLFKPQPEVPAEEIEAKAQASVRKVIDYYKEQGIDLGYVPRVKYTGESCRINANAFAAVDNEIESYKNVLGLVGATLAKKVYEKQFGLQLSDEALRESIEVAKVELETMFPNGILGDDADIFLYRPVQNQLDNLDEWMAHEVWHLIERKHGVLDGNGFIHEGTATYAQNRFAGRESEWRGSEADYFGTVYNNTAHLVQEEVGKEPNPLKAILDTERRRAIQAKFDERILPLFYEKAAEMIEAGATRDFGKDVLLTHPAYEAFRKNPNADSLLSALRQRGYVKLADECSRQDMTKAVEYNRELLN